MGNASCYNEKAANTLVLHFGITALKVSEYIAEAVTSLDPSARFN